MRFALRLVVFLVLLPVSQIVWGQSGLYTVTGDGVVVRSGPGKNHSKIDAKNKGDTVQVLSFYDADWALLRLEDDKVGYMSRKYLSYSGPLPRENDVQGGKRPLRTLMGGMEMNDKGKFWLFFGLAVLFYYLSLALPARFVFLSIVFLLLSAGSLFVWTMVCGECFWFLDFERQNFLLWLLFWVLTIIGLGFVGGTAWQHLKALRDIFHDFVPSIICVVIGIVWGVLFLRLVGIMFDEHPIISILTILGAIPSSQHVPTIYVKGEGHITGHGHSGGSEFTGDNGHEYWYDGDEWHRH